MSVFDDVIKFIKEDFLEIIDMIIVGFLCIGFSIVGSCIGFEYKESGLFVDVVCIIEEYKLKLVFLENSYMLSYIYNLDVVVKIMDKIGYFCKWIICCVSVVGVYY